MNDRFRKKYVELHPLNRDVIAYIKSLASELANAVEPAQSRELSLSLTKLEEAVFWATKHFSAPERQ